MKSLALIILLGLIAGCATKPVKYPPMPSANQVGTAEATVSRSTSIVPPSTEIVLSNFKVANTNKLTMWMVLSSTDAKNWKFETWLDGTATVKSSSPQCFYRLEGVYLNAIKYNWKPL